MKNTNEKMLVRAEELARELHSLLSINDKEWHQQKGIPDRRAAELISAAILQLICGGEKNDIENLLEQSLKWLKREVKDPGCPNH